MPKTKLPISTDPDVLLTSIHAATIKRGDPKFERFDAATLVAALEQLAQPLPENIQLALQTLFEAVSPRPLSPEEERERAAAAGIVFDNVTPWEKAQPAYATIERLHRIDHPLTEERKLIARIQRLLSGATNQPASLETAEPWAAAAKQDIDALPDNLREKWNALLFHLQSADGSKPANKWLKQAETLLADFGKPRFKKFITAWLPLTPRFRTDLPYVREQFVPDPNALFSDTSVASLKGLAWAASLINDAEVSTALGDLGETCWKKIPQHGPRNKLVGNAVLWALSAIGSNHAVAQLTRINSKLKHASARALADRAMNRVAESTGQTREDLEDLAVPGFNLDSEGKTSRKIAGFTATLFLTPALDVNLEITDKEGKTRKSVPADIKSHADLKSLLRLRKEMETVIPSQRLRIESTLRFPDRSWKFPDWKSRYLHHPLLSHLTTRLIWQFDDGKKAVTAIPHNGKLLQSDNTPLKTPDSGLRTKLWHPCTSSPEEVRAWRNFLIQHHITQPFKQAHREVYLLTDAERRTETYSNRFAAHILRQHQFAALCAARGWNYRLQGSFDSHNTPTLELPALQMKAEFWVEQTAGWGAGDAAYTANMIAVNLATDQVRFYRWNPVKLSRTEERRRFLDHLDRITMARNEGLPIPAEPDPSITLLPLHEVPAQPFSEIMRDVDLFVGVSSVGNDPTWNDGGPTRDYREYWESFSFGDLSATAQTRSEILTTLLPRLAIANQCSLSDRFLIVNGSLRTYKIHLGSANIRMDPNDEYLCIVPDFQPRDTANLYLPFEGDRTLSLILSKAFLLANDQKITDPTITRQIHRGSIPHRF